MRASNVNSPDTVIHALSNGHTCDLEGPGWTDTGYGPCPDCGKVTGYFKAQPAVRFYYGIDLCRPHRCGHDVPWRDQGPPERVRRLQAQQQLQNTLARQYEVPLDSKGVHRD